jgi:hypothetical protein
MPIEKVFAIQATPREIFAAIEGDLASAAAHEGDTHELLARDEDRSIDLRVTIGGIPCRLRYVIEQKDGQSEVTGTLTPYGWRYAAFRTMTFGLRDHNFAVALVESLANLKAAVETEGVSATEVTE